MDIIDIAIAKSKSTAVDPSDISSAVSDYLDEHGVQVETDTTLSVAGMPADADVVGNIIDNLQDVVEYKAPSIIGEVTDDNYTNSVTHEKQTKVFGNTFENETVKLYSSQQFSVDNFRTSNFSNYAVTYAKDDECLLINGTVTVDSNYVWVMGTLSANTIPERLKGKSVNVHIVSDKPCVLPLYGTNQSSFGVIVRTRKYGETNDGTNRITLNTGKITNGYIDLHGTLTFNSDDELIYILLKNVATGASFENVRIRVIIYESDTNIYDTESKINNGESLKFAIPDGYTVVDTGVHKNALIGVVDTKEYVDNHIPSDMITMPILNDYIPTVKNLMYITPEMYGAVGDGVTDDSIAFQNALNAITPSVPFRAFQKYRINTGLVVRGDNLDIFINYIDYRGSTNPLITLSGSYSRFHANLLYGYFATDNAPVLRLETTEQLHARYNDIKIQSIYSNGNCIELINRYGVSHTRHMYYNIFHCQMMLSSNANIIYLSADKHANENSFWCKHVSNGNGYVFYADPNNIESNSTTNRLYEFCIENASKNGVFGLATLIHCRTCECMGRRGLDGNTEQGNIYVIEGFCKPQNIKTVETELAYNNFVVENAATFDDWLEYCGELIGEIGLTFATDKCISAYNNNYVVGKCSSLWLAYDDPVYHHVGYYGIRGNLIAYYNHKGFVPSIKSYANITDNNYRTMFTDSKVPTIFDIDVSGKIYLDDSYCCVGIDEIEIRQHDGYTTQVYAKDGTTVIFDGSELGDGIFKVKCNMTPITQINIPLPDGTTYEYKGQAVRGLYSGTNEEWIVEKLNII